MSQQLLQGHLNQCFKGFCFLPKGICSIILYLVKVDGISYFFFIEFSLNWKWALNGLPLYSREKLNSMNLLLYMAPIAVVFLLPATLIMEENVVGITLALARDDVKIIWYLLFNSALAYFVNLTNFLVTKHTSALTLQVCLPSWSRHLYIVNQNVLWMLLNTCNVLAFRRFHE